MEVEGVSSEVIVKFSTRVSSLRVPGTSLSIPLRSNKESLCKIIGSLLGRDEEEEPLRLEFFAPGSERNFVRATLAKYLSRLGLSKESVLTLEYIPEAVPPIPAPSIPMDDWVGALDASEHCIFAGLYDGNVQIYVKSLSSSVSGSSNSASNSSSSSSGATTGSSQRLALSQAIHAGAVKSLHAVEMMADSGSSYEIIPTCRLASAGLDSIVRVWDVSIDSGGGGGGGGGKSATTTSSSSSRKARSSSLSTSESSASLSLVAECKLPGSGSCSTARLDPSGREYVAAGDSSGGLHIWSAAARATTTSGDDDEVDAGMKSNSSSGLGPATKRSKRSAREDTVDGDASSTASTPSLPRLPIISHSTAHAANVTSIAWLSSDALATGSWDQTLKVWDVERLGGGGSSSIGGSTSSSPSSASLSLALKVSLMSPKTIHCLAASPLGSVLASGHADRCVRIWDSRGRRNEGAEATLAGTAAATGLRATCILPSVASSSASASSSRTASSGAAASPSPWISSLSFCPTSAHLLSATCMDGVVTVWDLRSPKEPLSVLSGPCGDAMLSTAWSPSPSSRGAASSSSSASASSGSAPAESTNWNVLFGGADKLLHSYEFVAGSLGI